MMNRLWVVTECYPKPWDLNHCIFAHRQLAGLSLNGWEVRVLIPNGWFPRFAWRVAPAWREARRRSIPEGWSRDGVSVQDLRYQNRVPSRLCRPLDSVARVAEALAGELRAEGARPERDLVLSQFALPYGPAVRDACERLGLRYAVQLRGDDVWVWPHQASEKMDGFRKTVLDAALVMGVSRSILDEASELAGSPLAGAAVVPNGLDLDLFRPATSEERAEARSRIGVSCSAFVVLCVGAAIARKGWRELMQALARLQNEEVVLLAATTALNPEIDLAVEHRTLASRVKLVPKRDLPASELATLFSAADVFCLPTYGEGMSNSLLEAMAAGLPVVTTPVGGHAEVIDDGVEGLLVEAREIASLTNALGRLEGSADLRRRMGMAARRRAEVIGTPFNAGERLSRMFDQVLRMGPPIQQHLENPYASALEVVA